MAASEVMMASNRPAVTSPSASNNASPPGGWEGSPTRQSNDLSYMHRPPTIMPNYGKKYKGGLKLKTNVPRVLLYDNVTQQTMLDVQLTGIQSQQYKTGRELEMHMKSFLLRRHHKDKLLNKLTKVHHGDDYTEFEQEYFGNDWDEEGDRSRGGGGGMSNGYHNHNNHHHSGLTLPNIQMTNGVGKNGGRERGRKKLKRGRSLPGLTRSRKVSNGYSIASLDGGSSSGNQENGEAATLPTITTSLPSSPAAKNGQGQRSPAHHFVPRRKVGFRMEKGDKGVTRIFHALPSGDDTGSQQNGDTPIAEEAQKEKQEKECTLPADSSGPAGDSHTAINAILDANKPDVVVVTEAESSGEANQTEAVNGHDVMEGMERERTINMENPVLDYRFELLQHALVPQFPPNDGFIELSPSFVRPSPLLYTEHKMAQLGLRRNRELLAPPTREGRRSMLSEGVTPPLSDGYQSDSEDEREAPQEHRANSALMRLGAR